MGLQLPQAPQAATAPTAGAMPPSSGAMPPQALAQPPAQGGGYTGPITFNGKTTDVVEGNAEVDGHKIFVSADGKVVLAENKTPLGEIDAKGNFTPMEGIAQHAQEPKGQ